MGCRQAYFLWVAGGIDEMAPCVGLSGGEEETTQASCCCHARSVWTPLTNHSPSNTQSRRKPSMTPGFSYCLISCCRSHGVFRAIIIPLTGASCDWRFAILYRLLFIPLPTTILVPLFLGSTYTLAMFSRNVATVSRSYQHHFEAIAREGSLTGIRAYGRLLAWLSDRQPPSEPPCRPCRLSISDSYPPKRRLLSTKPLRPRPSCFS